MKKQNKVSYDNIQKEYKFNIKKLNLKKKNKYVVEDDILDTVDPISEDELLNQ